MAALKEIKAIDIMSLAKMSAIISAIAGFIFGIFVAAGMSMMTPTAGVPGFGFGILAVIAFPIIYGIAGLIGGAIVAIVYNLVAEKIGGVKIDI